jgi:hypothetical protein
MIGRNRLAAQDGRQQTVDFIEEEWIRANELRYLCPIHFSKFPSRTLQFKA